MPASMAAVPDRTRPWLALAGVLIVAALLRGLGLQQLPHLTDETGEVLWAWEIAFASLRPLSHTDAYNGPFWPYLLAAALRLFGSSAELPRLFAMVLSLATVAASFWLGWMLGPRGRQLTAASLTGLLMATAFTPVLVNGRVAWSNSSTPLWTTLTAICVVQAARRLVQHGDRDGKGWGRWLLGAGLLAGLALQTHPSALVFLVGIGAWWLLDRSRRDALRGRWPWLAVLASLLAYSPVIAFNLFDGFQTFREAGASINWAPGDVAPGPAGTVAAVLQLGRSVLGGFDLEGPSGDPVWRLACALWSLGLLIGALVLARAKPPASGAPEIEHLVASPPSTGRRLPAIVVFLALIGLPAFNRNWHGFLEARYLGYTLPLLFAAAAYTLTAHGALPALDTWRDQNPTTRRRAWLPSVAMTVLVLLPALRGLGWQRDAYREQYDNRRLWAMLHRAQAVEAEGAAVYVDRELKQVGWRAGGQPRRAVEYLLRIEGEEFVQAPAEKMNHFLGLEDDLLMFLAGDTVLRLREWGHTLVEIDVEPRPGEEPWGLYRSGRESDGS